MGLILLLSLQAAAVLAGFVILWRRIERQGAEIARLREALAAAEARQVNRRRAQGTAVVPISASAALAENAPQARAARAWGLTRESIELPLEAPTLSPETGRSLALAAMAAAPAAGFFFDAEIPAIVATGLAIAAAMMVISLRPMWRAAAWAAVLTAGAWALLGFALQTAHAQPVSYSVLVAAAAASGLTHAHLRRAAPGTTMTLAMAAAALALGSQIGMVSAAGLSFGAIVAMAAVVGAMSLRLEGVYLASFGAALLGLFVLSGQDAAAIWFTPAAAWSGALYIAIAFIRAPQLGPRAAAIAGVGALAPYAAIAALYGAQHGLADRLAAAGAFATLSALLSAVIALSASRDARGLEGMRLTLWILALGAFTALASAIVLAAPPPLAVPAFAAIALGLTYLNTRFESGVWRAFASLSALAAGIFALLAARLLLSEASDWPAWSVILTGFAASAAIAGAAAWLAPRTSFTAGLLEALTLLLIAVGASLVLRVAYSGGALLLQPVGFAEAGAHCAAWLAISLAAAARAKRGVGRVRIGAAVLLALLAFLVSGAAAALLMTEYWTAQAASAPSLWTRQTIGFALPALLFWAHWAFWRGRGAELRARTALGAAALLTAAFVAFETLQAAVLPDWVGGLVGALAFALAAGVNFAPGVARRA